MEKESDRKRNLIVSGEDERSLRGNPRQLHARKKVKRDQHKKY